MSAPYGPSPQPQQPPIPQGAPQVPPGQPPYSPALQPPGQSSILPSYNPGATMFYGAETLGIAVEGTGLSPEAGEIKDKGNITIFLAVFVWLVPVIGFFAAIPSAIWAWRLYKRGQDLGMPPATLSTHKLGMVMLIVSAAIIIPSYLVFGYLFFQGIFALGR
ncbi:MAG: hypothetical protein Q4C87_12355 [Actinomycetaceae bacterium]|nr:hypothetical protein [Actinomycetaceae bacterium]